jgi:hypothetical protein
LSYTRRHAKRSVRRPSRSIVLIVVLIGAKLGGIGGALVAIPVAGAIQVVPRDVPPDRRAQSAETEALPAVELVLASDDG